MASPPPPARTGHHSHRGRARRRVQVAGIPGARGSPNVSDGKRQAVQQAIDELGYRPNAIARQLTERRTNMVGVLLNDLRNPWFIDCLEGLTSVLHEQGLRTLLADGRMDRRTDDSLLQGFLELRVDGLVLVGTMASSPTIVEAAAAVPTVVAASRDITLPRVDVIANDDWIGTQLAVNHLIGLGTHPDRPPRRFARGGGRPAPPELPGHHARARAFRTGLIETVRHDRGGRLPRSGSPARPHGPPTAIFAVNDITCIGAMSAAQELGLRVPQEISLVGYDNTSLAQIRHLWLTSVDNASAEVGRRAAMALLRRIADPDGRRHRAIDPADLAGAGLNRAAAGPVGAVQLTPSRNTDRPAAALPLLNCVHPTSCPSWLGPR